jgi:hypothetical protein
MNSLLRPLGQRRPLLIFGILGTAGLIAGFALGGIVIAIYMQNRILSLGYAIASSSLCIAGAVSWLSGIVLRTVRDIRVAVSNTIAAEPTTVVASRASRPADQSLALLLLGLPGTIVLLAGLALGARAVNIVTRTHTFAAGTGIICTSLCIVGLMAGCTGIILHALQGILAELETQ